MAAVLRAHRCEMMFVPHPEDAHPDHIAATLLASAGLDPYITRVDPLRAALRI